MKREAHGTQQSRHINKIGESASTAQRCDSLVQPINQRFLNKFSFVLLLLLGLFGGIATAFATHISQPIVTDLKTQYAVGETVILRGWVNYNEQATPDVLLNFKVTRPDGSVALDRSYPSNAEGWFEFEFETKNENPGTYRVTITSHCLEIHRYACTYKNQTVPIQLHR